MGSFAKGLWIQQKRFSLHTLSMYSKTDTWKFTFMAGGAHSGRSHSRFNIQICSKCLPLYKYIKSLQGISTQFTLHTIAHWVDILDLVLCICSCSVPLIASMEQRVGVFRMSPSSEDSFLCCTVKCYMYNLELLSVGRVCCACGCTVLGTKIGGQGW